MSRMEFGTCACLSPDEGSIVSGGDGSSAGGVVWDGVSVVSFDGTTVSGAGAVEWGEVTVGSVVRATNSGGGGSGLCRWAATTEGVRVGWFGRVVGAEEDRVG
jgi:hypothetical protein